MSTNLESAKQFFEACETGKGWEDCKAFCHPDAPSLRKRRSCLKYPQWKPTANG